METYTVTETMFSTAGQYNKYLKIRDFFSKLITMKKDGFFFLVDGEIERNPYIDGFKMGFRDNSDLARTVFVGSSFIKNKDTGEYDVLWIDISLKELKQRIIPLKMFDWKQYG